MRRQGRRWDAIESSKVAVNANRKIVDDSGSFEKFVDGVRRDSSLSCTREKSSMQFCRSRMLRKKSFERSFTGFTVGAGAIGGPVEMYGVLDVVEGGAGCRAMKEGIRRPRRRKMKGRTVRRYGSRQMKV